MRHAHRLAPQCLRASLLSLAQLAHRAHVRRMKPTDITLDTSACDIFSAVERGDFSFQDVGAQRARIRRDAERRATDAQIALNTVRDDDCAHSEPRKNAWRVKWLAREGVFEVCCGPAEWHVKVFGGEVDYWVR